MRKVFETAQATHQRKSQTTKQEVIAIVKKSDELVQLSKKCGHCGSAG